MPKFNWEGKTGITEAQWAQVVQAVLWFTLYKLGYQEFAIHAFTASTIIIGGLGKILRSRQKVKFKEVRKGIDGVDILVKEGCTEKEVLKMIMERKND